MGEDFGEIDVSIDLRIVSGGFGFCFVVDSTSTGCRAVFVNSTCVDFWEQNIILYK